MRPNIKNLYSISSITVSEKGARVESATGAGLSFISAAEDLPQVICKASRGQSRDSCLGLLDTDSLRKE